MSYCEHCFAEMNAQDARLYRYCHKCRNSGYREQVPTINRRGIESWGRKHRDPRMIGGTPIDERQEDR